MSDESVKRFGLTDEFLLESAETRFQNGDYMGALTMLNKRAEKFEPIADACALYADVYEALEIYDRAADSWFRFLDTCNEADFAEGYEGLALAFMNMGNEFQSAYYYQRALQDDGSGLDAFKSEFDDEDEEEEEEEVKKPNLRIVHSSDGDDGEAALALGLAYFKAGALEKAREALKDVPENSKDFSTAWGIAAMCTLMLGDEAGAEESCEQLLKKYPDNVQGLTTYCAVLGARGKIKEAQETAKMLARLKTEATEDLYRVATALCETELDDEAFEKLQQLKKRLPNDENVLFFLAAASYRTGKIDEGIETLERFTTLFPKKAVAQYYLERMRKVRDGEEEPFSMSYYYKMPAEEYATVGEFLLSLAESDGEAEKYASLPSLDNFLRLAFDELEGRDEKMQMLALKVAIKARKDAFLRDVLLDYEGNEMVKIAILEGLVARNEDNSFGVIVCNLYKEFFTHKIILGRVNEKEFLKAFASVYSKFSLLGEENERKICVAAEDIYRTLDEARAWEYMKETSALSAAIYREARLRHGEHGIENICKIFGADRLITQEILDYFL